MVEPVADLEAHDIAAGLTRYSGVDGLEVLCAVAHRLTELAERIGGSRVVTRGDFCDAAECQRVMRVQAIVAVMRDRLESDRLARV